ncbi:MAG: hypothetical protein JXR96_02640 [Deltaproteobacteria bacterium]|nr:hypothetical protein [Deltaproteobacteria bacterium]
MNAAHRPPSVARMFFAGSVLLLSLVAQDLRPAGACSCIVGLREGFLFPSSGELPANARGLLWWTGGRHVRAGDDAALGVRFRVEQLDGEGAVERAFDRVWIEDGLVLIALRSPPPPRSRFRFRGQRGEMPAVQLEGCIESCRKVELRFAAEPLAAPSQAPALELGAQRFGELRVRAGGSCSVHLYARQQPLRMRLPPGLERWRQALLFRTLVDDKSWKPAHSICEPVPPGRSWAGPGRDLLYTGCPRDPAEMGGVRLITLGDSGLEPGAHAVRMRAELPGTEIAFEASAAIELRCRP